MICFQRSSTRWSKGKAFCVVHFVMRFVLVSSVMSCVVFKGNINKKASKTDFMLQIFPIPFLTFPVESKISHVTETEVSVKHSKKKRCPFHYRGLECENKSRNTWSNRQIWPLSTKQSWSKANRFLPRERTGHSKHPLPTTQEKTTHGHHQMINTKIRLIIFFAAKDEEAV